MRLDKDVEIELIRRACNGDDEAITQLYKAYQKAVYGFIRARVRQDADAEDVAQETWIEVWKKLPAYDPAKGSFFTWIRYWAGLKLLRHYKELKDWRRIHVLISELRSRYPDLDEEEEIADIIDRLTIAEVQPDEPEKDAEEYAYILRITFEKGGYPWQLIAFGFNKLIDEWKPKRIVAELSDSELQKLGKKLEYDYLAESMLPEEEVRDCFEPLRGQMSRLVGDVLLPGDTVSRENLREILSIHVGDTTLRNYYGKDPEANISDWSNKVRKRVFREVVQRGNFDC